MRKILWVAALCVSSAKGVRAQSDGIRFFKGTWAEAQKKARTEHKLVFLDGYAVWCAPCKRMAKEVFIRKEAGDYFNAHFVCISLDMTKGEGAVLRKRYNLNQFPALEFMKPGGYRVKDVTGSQTTEELVADAKEAFDKKDSVTMEETLDKGGYKDTAWLKTYITYALTDGRPGTLQQAINRLAELGGPAIFKRGEPYWGILGLCWTGEPPALYFTSHWKDFAAVYGREAVLFRIAGMYLNIRRLNSYRKPDINDTSEFMACRERLKQRDIPAREFIAAAMDFYLACTRRDMRAAFDLADKALAGGEGWQYQEMALLANWMVVADMPLRSQAAGWADKAAFLWKDGTRREECQALARELRQDLSASIIPSPEFLGNHL